jgi:uncharacterized BrkB/YihY/UPF0761 family membrane protein
VSTGDGRPASNEILPPDERTGTGRIAKWRARAEDAANSYQEHAQRQPLLGLPLSFVARYTARQGVLLASAAAFRLFLWLLPLALLAAGILAGAAADHEASLESAGKVAGVTGAASHYVVTALHDAHRSWWAAVLLGTLLFLWATRKLVGNLTVVNAHLWGVPLPSGRQRDALVTSVIVAGGWVIVVMATGFLWRLHDIHFVGAFIAIAAQTLILAASWLFISLRLPARSHAKVDLAPGCLVFGLGLALLNAVSRTYLAGSFEHSSNLYGPLGIAAVILGWLLIVGHFIVSSALINVVWSEYRRDRDQRRSADASDS